MLCWIRAWVTIWFYVCNPHLSILLSSISMIIALTCCILSIRLYLLGPRGASSWKAPCTFTLYYNINSKNLVMKIPLDMNHLIPWNRHKKVVKVHFHFYEWIPWKWFLFHGIMCYAQSFISMDLTLDTELDSTNKLIQIYNIITWFSG